MYICQVCKYEIDEKTHDYSIKKFDMSLCRKHQTLEISQWKDGKDNDRRYNMIKGRIAETLIEELFLALGYDVFRYGMENTVPGVMKLLRGVEDEVAHNIKRMPDFVVKKGDKLFFIEVKFRAKELFDNTDSSIQNYPYKNCYFIIVSKEHIKCITYDELKNGEKITPEDRKYLGNRKEFDDLDKEVIKEFCEFAKKFFKEV